MTVRTRYLVLHGLRWLPVGLMIPVTVLLAQERGLTLSQIGLVMAVQGLVVLGLELPTGGLADTVGRRPVLLLASVISLGSLVLLVFARGFWMFAAFCALQGVFRALDSGPLDSWYVDAALAEDPDARFESGLSRAGTVLGCAIGGGALLAGGLVALDPVPAVSALTAPLVAAVALQAVTVVAIAVLLREPPRRAARDRLASTVRGVPGVVGDAVRLLRRSRVLAALVGVELFWAFGMMTFETLFPVRLSELLGDLDTAGTVMGPVSSVAWLASAAGAALVPLLVRRLGPAWSGVTLQVAQALAVVGIGLCTGPAGAIAAYLVCYALHGAVNPVWSGLLHRQADSTNRTTVASLGAMVAQPSGALGGIVLTTLADATSVRAAILIGAVPLAVAALGYLPARHTPPPAPGADTPVPPLTTAV